MKKYTRILYWITLASVLLLVTLFWSFETVDESLPEVSKGFTILTDVEQCCSLVEADPAAFARAAGEEKTEADYATA